MRISKVTIQSFKRFHHLTIQNIPETAKLVVMTGANGCGKSSIFDAFLLWYKKFLNISNNHTEDYHNKAGLPLLSLNDLVDVYFHGKSNQNQAQNRKIFHFRTAYRNDADFASSSLQKVQENAELNRIRFFIDNDISVAHNYQRLVAETLSALYGGEQDSITVKELREKLIGQIGNSMKNVFDDLVLEGIGDALQNGTFLFTKGASKDFKYKNLSGGEKACFDLLLDFVVKKDYYTDTIFCIDEPETHLNSRVQSKLLQELFNILPNNCQLWIATHSIGMMRRARDLQTANPEDVVFLDFNDKDFDCPQILEPHPVNRVFWERTLRVTLDEISELVVPQQLVICEGNPKATGNPQKSEFDAKCYQQIFASQFLDTQFISAGGANDIKTDRLAFARTIEAIAKGIKIIRLIDRDDSSEEEIKEFNSQGIRVLSLRNIESYLYDDEVLVHLCTKHFKSDKLLEVLKAKKDALQRSVARTNPEDDIKSAGGEIYNSIKKILSLRQVGNNADSFARDTLAPLITPETKIYQILKKDIFQCGMP